jgi:hypothetical protein
MSFDGRVLTIRGFFPFSKRLPPRSAFEVTEIEICRLLPGRPWRVIRNRAFRWESCEIRLRSGVRIVIDGHGVGRLHDALAAAISTDSRQQ